MAGCGPDVHSIERILEEMRVNCVLYYIVTTQVKKTKQNNIDNIKKRNLVKDFFLH